jgi:D-alanine-D-alanine ligase
MKKLNVAVIFGSRSTEHDISIVTAIASIIKPLELSGKYEVVPVYIDKQGRWYTHPRLQDIALYSSGQIDSFLAKLQPLKLRMGGKLELISGSSLKSKVSSIDVAFPATHGTHGEDGELMGLLEMAGVPYVGCPMPAAAIAMDKALAKTVAASASISTPKYVWFYAREFKADQQEVLSRITFLNYPLFVKPVHLGSSIAINKVENVKELINAIEVAAHYDDKILVEEAVENLIEVTLPIIGNETPRPALLEQPLLNSDNAVFDFASKYLSGNKKNKSAKSSAQGYSKLPADLPKELYQRAEQTALAVYKVLGCAGIARVDLLIDAKTNEVYFNEVNPLPGSLYAHNWRQAGLSNVQLCEKLVDLALERYQDKQKLTTAFTSSYLKQTKL